MSAIEDSMKAAAKAAEAAARFCRTMMRLEHPSDCKETREEQFVGDWFVTRKMDKEPTYADAIEWADKQNEEFVTLVTEMRDAQRNYYKERRIVGAKVAYKNMLNKEFKVDQWLKKHKEE